MPRLETDRISDPLYLTQQLTEEVITHLPAVRFCYLYKVRTPDGIVSGTQPTRTKAFNRARNLGSVIKVIRYPKGCKLGNPYLEVDGNKYQRFHVCDKESAVNGRKHKNGELLYRLVQVE